MRIVSEHEMRRTLQDESDPNPVQLDGRTRRVELLFRCRVHKALRCGDHNEVRTREVELEDAVTEDERLTLSRAHVPYREQHRLFMRHLQTQRRVGVVNMRKAGERVWHRWGKRENMGRWGSERTLSVRLWVSEATLRLHTSHSPRLSSRRPMHPKRTAPLAPPAASVVESAVHESAQTEPQLRWWVPYDQPL